MDVTRKIIIRLSAVQVTCVSSAVKIEPPSMISVIAQSSMLSNIAKCMLRTFNLITDPLNFDPVPAAKTT